MVGFVSFAPFVLSPFESYYFSKMYEEKRKNEEQASFGIPQGRRHFNTNNNHNTNNDMKRQYPNEHMRNNSFQKEKAQMGQSSQSQPFLCLIVCSLVGLISILTEFEALLYGSSYSFTSG
jgi:hypothetical protein